MNSREENIVIIGAGISGLSTAIFLKERGVNSLIIEKSTTPGGVLTSIKEGGFTMDFASNSTLEKNIHIAELIEYLDIKDEVLTANRESKSRIILRNNTLHTLAGPLSLIMTKLISWRGKFRVLKEPFIKVKRDGSDESVADFVSRRLGKELLDYVLNPVISGIFAGDPKELSLKAAYSNMQDMELQHGSIIAGSVAKILSKSKSSEPKPSRAMLSFKEGMQQLTDSAYRKIEDQIETEATVTSITKSGSGYVVTYKKGDELFNVTTKRVITTTPAYITSKLISQMAKEVSSPLCSSLDSIKYPPVMVLNLGYRVEDIAKKLDSFGFLIPESEKKSFLGAIWSSTIFKNRAPEGRALFTIFIGGSRNSDILSKEREELIREVKSDFESIMGIEGEAIMQKDKVWPKAIPQYNIGHLQIVDEINQFQNNYPGITISGNYIGGNAVADCINHAYSVASKVL